MARGWMWCRARGPGSRKAAEHATGPPGRQADGRRHKLKDSGDSPPPPRLGQIFTAEQLREYRRNLDESLERVRKVLVTVVGKNLNRDLTEMVGRIQTFQRQAGQARETDLVTAVNLARRADLLAQDLLKRLP